MRPQRQGWFTRLVKRILDWIFRLFAWFKARFIGCLSDPDNRPLVDTPSLQRSPKTSQVHQQVTGDRNPVIGVIETDSRVTIDQSIHHYGHSPLPTGEPTPFGVPYQRNHFFTGREVILERLHQQLNQETTAAITQVQAISGLGGIGKTQTAVEYAYRYHHDVCLYHYVFWVRADTEAALITDFANLANQLALPVAQSTQEEKNPAVRAWLANHSNWLLIFDNADTPGWLIPWMPTNPKGKVVITSRATIFDQLGVDTPIALDVLSEQEAIDLLFQRTKYERTVTNTAAATEINQELDGLPLALEQASAFIVRKRIGFQTYLKTYRKQGLSHLEKVNAQTGRYPSSVLKTWNLNFQAVAAENLAASELLKFSAFLASDDIPYWLLITGAVDLGETLGNCLQREDADEALLAVGELLEPLSHYSLVRWESKRQCYSVHRLVQAVVRDEMNSATQVTWIECAIAAVDTAYPGSDFTQWTSCAQLLPHWLQVREWANQTGLESEALGRICHQAGFYLNAQGRYSEAEPLYQENLAMTKRLLGDENPEVALSLNNLGMLYMHQGRYSEAEPLLKRALVMSKRFLGDEHPNVATNLNNLALFYSKQERYSEAEPLYQESLALRRRLWGKGHPDVARSLNNLGWLYGKQGRYREAEPLLKEAIVLRKQLLGDEHPSVARSLTNLAMIYDKQERYDEAEILYQEAVVLFEQIVNLNRSAEVLIPLQVLFRMRI